MPFTGRQEFEIRSMLSARLQEEGDRETWTRIFHLTNRVLNGEDLPEFNLTEYGTIALLLNRVAREELGLIGK